jgi:hypothetical protein
MARAARKTTPRVPHDTPMWEDAEQTKMSRTWVIFFERLGRVSNEDIDDPELKATFGLVRELTVEDDLTLHYIAKKPGRFTGLLVNGKQPATGSTVHIVIEKWKYDTTYLGEGDPQEWLNIFADIDEGPGYIELADFDELDPPLDEGTPYLEVFSPAAGNCEFKTEHDGEDGQIEAGDLLRINCTQIGSTFAGKGYEIVLHWEPLQ